jgi:hypothetical protein
VNLSLAPVTPSRTVAAAAPGAVARLLSGEVRRGTVVHSGADAAYVVVDDACVGLLSASAWAVPCGLRTTLPDLDVPVGTPAAVGGGLLALPGLQVGVGRLVDARVPLLTGRPDPATLRAHPAVRRVRASLPPAPLEALAAGSTTGATDLLGRGDGLTPVGDDVLCGYLAGVRATGRPDLAAAAAAVGVAPQRTTALSAQLLRCAADGEVLPEFAALVRALPDPAAALDALLAVGHTSGAGLALGLLLALDATHPTRNVPGRTQP